MNPDGFRRRGMGMHKLRRRIEVLEEYVSARRDYVSAAETFVRLARDPASGKWVVREHRGKPAGAGRRGIKIDADAIMRSLLGRLKALEAKSPDPAEPRKALLPAWLTDELERQGGFDASGYPVNVGVDSGCESQRLGGIQRAQFEKS